MRACWLTLLVLVSLGALPGVAAAEPAAGGHYSSPLESAQGPCDSCGIDLVVAYDRRSLLADLSLVRAPCETTSFVFAQAPRVTRIRPDGTFAWKAARYTVRGRFEPDGSAASGTVRTLPGRNCAISAWTFRAPLSEQMHYRVRGACSALSLPRFLVTVKARDASCDQRRRVVLGWWSAKRCVSDTGTASACRAAGFGCKPVDGGRLDAFAGVACTRGRSQVELAIARRCADRSLDSHDFGVAAFSADCATARRVARAWDASGCRARRCRVGAWTCRHPRAGAPTGCLRPGPPRMSLKIFRIDRNGDQDG